MYWLYVYTDYWIRFSEFSLLEGSVRKNVITVGVDMSSSVHIDIKKQDILILEKNPTQRLDDTTLTTLGQYSINFSRSKRKICLNLHHNESNSNKKYINLKQKILK